MTTKAKNTDTDNAVVNVDLLGGDVNFNNLTQDQINDYLSQINAQAKALKAAKRAQQAMGVNPVTKKVTVKAMVQAIPNIYSSTFKLDNDKIKNAVIDKGCDLADKKAQSTFNTTLNTTKSIILAFADQLRKSGYQIVKSK